MRRHRLAQRRKAVGLSQERLAERIGVDRSTVVRWERADTDPQPWHRPRLARALGISVDELAVLLANPNELYPRASDRSAYALAHGSPMSEGDSIGGLPPMNRRERLLTVFGKEQPLLEDWRMWIRRAVIDRSVPSAESPPLPDLAEALRIGNLAYQAASYSGLLGLPTIIGFAELLLVNTATSDLQRIARVAAEAYLLASKLASKLNAPDVAWTAADRALALGSMTGDPAVTAVAKYQMACALAKQENTLPGAEMMATEAANEVAGRDGASTRAGISARGALLLHAAIAAARQGRRNDAVRHLQLASAAADDLGRDANEMWTAFGPTNVQLHSISVAVAMGNLSQAIMRADAVDTSKLPPALVSRRAQVHLDLAAAHIQVKGSDPQALLHLLEYERMAPEAVSLNATTGRLIETMLGRERLSQTPGLRGLAKRAGVRR